VSNRPRAAASDRQPSKDAPAADARAAGAEPADLVKCRVVDGYLVLAPEGGAGVLPGAPADSHRVRVEQGTLELDFSATASLPSLLDADVGPDANTRAADLIASLADESIAVRRAAEEGLLELATAGSSAALWPYLRSDDPKVRSLVAGILGEAAAVGCLPDIARLAEDPEPSVRRCVMYAFARFGESAASYVNHVRKGLGDSDSSVRAGAVEALTAVLPRNEQAAKEVANLTGDAEPIVRQAATSASFAYALRGLAGPLVELLGDFSRRAQALEVLQQADDVVLWRLQLAARNSSAEGAQAALDTLSYVMGSRWSAADFREELESPDPDARLTGLEALAMIGGGEAVGLVRRVAEGDPLPEVRARAAEILARWGQWADHAPASPAERVRTKA
jgi:HEAT repeat protein